MSAPLNLKEEILKKIDLFKKRRSTDTVPEELDYYFRLGATMALASILQIMEQEENKKP